MRNALYMFRHKRRMNQQQMADVMGCSRNTYAAIEAGTAHGSLKFLINLKNGFGLTDAEIGELMKKE